MRKLLRIILLKPVLWLASKFSSRPKRERVFKALTELYHHIINHPGKKGIVIPFELNAGKFIIFSDQHKGRRNGADDFKDAALNYVAALDFYDNNNFCFINLGDSEELWENNIWQVKRKNKDNFEAEKKFLKKNNYLKIFGNHDLFWDNDPLAGWHLKSIYDKKVKVYEGIVLQTTVHRQQATADNSVPEGNIHATGKQEALLTTSHSPLPAETPAKAALTIFLTHGHQGDAQSDGNWFSKFFVSKIWAPLQALLRINPNTPAYDAEKKTLHNSMMYEWSSEQKELLLVTGHTHQPVFASLTHLEKLYKQFQIAKQCNNDLTMREIKVEIAKREKEFSAVAIDYMNMKPSYFNTGCCCFCDGDITGIEIADGTIRLIKWSMKESKSERKVLDEMKLEEIIL